MSSLFGAGSSSSNGPLPPRNESSCILTLISDMQQRKDQMKQSIQQEVIHSISLHDSPTDPSQLAVANAQQLINKINENVGFHSITFQSAMAGETADGKPRSALRNVSPGPRQHSQNPSKYAFPPLQRRSDAQVDMPLPMPWSVYGRFRPGLEVLRRESEQGTYFP